MKRKRIGTKTYYMVKQLDAIAIDGDADICTGCVFLKERELGNRCPEDKDEMVICQTYQSNGESDWLVDYIFVPATKQGLADYVAHRLEHS